MKLVLNILLPLGLAFVAGVINYAVLSRTTAMQSYIEVTSPLKPGDAYKMQMIKQAKVAAKVPGAIPWEERHVLATLRAPRAIETGDWIMLSDVVPQTDVGIGLDKAEVALNVSLQGIVIEPKLMKIGQPIGFVIRKAEATEGTAPSTPQRVNDSSQYQIVGPFRLATLGEFATQELDSEEEDQLRQPKTISVAVPSSDGKTLDEESQLLARAIEQSRITAIVLYPMKPKPVAEVPAKETEASKAAPKEGSTEEEKPAETAPKSDS